MLLIALPNVLGMINIATPWGFKIHLFQVAIILAAAIFGPAGGALSGFAGSIYAALIMGNPYLMVGNALLGFFTGVFLRHGFSLLPAVWIAFGMQLPWLILTDLYLVQLSLPMIRDLILALLLSNTLWAVAVHYSLPIIRKHLLISLTAP